MRARLVDESTLARWAGLAFWFGAAGLLPLRAVHAAAVLALVPFWFLAFLCISRVSPIPMIVRWRRRWLQARLARTPRIALLTAGERPDLLVALLVGVMSWLAPLFAGAYAVKNHGLGGTAAALVILALATVLAVRVIVGRPRETALTFGSDGLHLADVGFVAWAEIAEVETVVSGLRLVRRDASPVDIIVGEDHISLVSSEILRRRDVQREAPMRESMAAHVRVAAVPTSQLLAVLRDGSEPREERLRVAEVLRVAAPEELAAVANETADEDLAVALRLRGSA